ECASTSTSALPIARTSISLIPASKQHFAPVPATESAIGICQHQRYPCNTMTNVLPDGLYEQLINRLIEDRLAGMSESGRSADRRKLDAADSADMLARYVAGELARALHSLPADHRTEHQLALCNEILSLVRQRHRGAAPP